jgi:hypothetical protein
MTFADWTGWRRPALMEELPRNTQDTGDTAF